VRICLQGARLARWQRALHVLESDPIFAEKEVASLAVEAVDEEVLKTRARDLFRELSSGHKIVLLTVTRLVESVEERTLVLLDEPESHLHPPLRLAVVQGRGLGDRGAAGYRDVRGERLYSMQAAREISGIKARLDSLLGDSGSDAVSDHLRQDEESRLQAGLNSWQAACWGALAASDWFCAGSFRF
jgi:hypothetical protein